MDDKELTSLREENLRLKRETAEHLNSLQVLEHRLKESGEKVAKLVREDELNKTRIDAFVEEAKRRIKVTAVGTPVLLDFPGRTVEARIVEVRLDRVGVCYLCEWVDGNGALHTKSIPEDRVRYQDSPLVVPTLLDIIGDIQ